jgi:hypothetical protein
MSVNLSIPNITVSLTFWSTRLQSWALISTKATNHLWLFAPKTLLLFWDSIKLSLNEFYIHQLRENVTEPTDGEDEGGRDRRMIILGGQIKLCSCNVLPKLNQRLFPIPGGFYRFAAVWCSSYVVQRDFALLVQAKLD